MTPENNVQPTTAEAPEGVVTGMPENLQTSPEPVIEPVAEAVITGMPVELQTPEPEAMLEAGQPEPLLEAPAAPMQEFGGYTNITSPSAEQAEESLRMMNAAATSAPVEAPQSLETPALPVVSEVPKAPEAQ